MARLGVHLLSSLTRVSGNFLRTCRGLLLHPWKVVADYVLGRRVGLVSPISMLLLLALYWGLVMAALPHLSQGPQPEQMKLGALLKWLYGSITFQYLFLALPVALGTWVVYRRDMRGRFNFAELLIATLYLACTFLLVDLILFPLELIDSWAGNLAIVLITAFYGVASILKAFPQPKLKTTLLKLALWMLLCGALLFFFLLLFAIPLFNGR